MTDKLWRYRLVRAAGGPSVWLATQKPAAGGRLYIRTGSKLYCIGKH